MADTVNRLSKVCFINGAFGPGARYRRPAGLTILFVLMHHDALVNRLPVYQRGECFVTLVWGIFFFFELYRNIGVRLVGINGGGFLVFTGESSYIRKCLMNWIF